MKSWFTLPQIQFEEALGILIGQWGGNAWLDLHDDILIHPRDEVDEETLGCHQSCWCNLMPFREAKYRDRKLYVFECHIRRLTL